MNGVDERGLGVVVQTYSLRHRNLPHTFTVHHHHSAFCKRDGVVAAACRSVGSMF